MRRAVRDYKYEVNEGRMTEECNQYLQQLQKDWERHRVKIGVEQLRKEVRDILARSGSSLRTLISMCNNPRSVNVNESGRRAAHLRLSMKRR